MRECDQAPAIYTNKYPQPNRWRVSTLQQLSLAGFVTACMERLSSSVVAQEISARLQVEMRSVSPAACVSQVLISCVPVAADAVCQFIAMLICAAGRFYALALPGQSAHANTTPKCWRAV